MVQTRSRPCRGRRGPRRRCRARRTCSRRPRPVRRRPPVVGEGGVGAAVCRVRRIMIESKMTNRKMAKPIPRTSTPTMPRILATMPPPPPAAPGASGAGRRTGWRAVAAGSRAAGGRRNPGWAVPVSGCCGCWGVPARLLRRVARLLRLLSVARGRGIAHWCIAPCERTLKGVCETRDGHRAIWDHSSHRPPLPCAARRLRTDPLHGHYEAVAASAGSK